MKRLHKLHGRITRHSVYDTMSLEVWERLSLSEQGDDLESRRISSWAIGRQVAQHIAEAIYTDEDTQ